MGSLFHTDGKLYQFLVLIYDLFVLNILWFICSLPIITMGAATTALYYVMLKRLRKEDAKPVQQFFKSFLANFKTSTIVSFILLCFTGVIYLTLNNQESLEIPIFFIYLQYPVLVVLGLILIYIFPLIASFHSSVANYFKNAFLLSITHLITTILCGITLFSLIYIMIHFWEPISLILIPLYTLWSGYFIERVLGKYRDKNNSI